MCAARFQLLDDCCLMAGICRPLQFEKRQSPIKTNLSLLWIMLHRDIEVPQCVAVIASRKLYKPQPVMGPGGIGIIFQRPGWVYNTGVERPQIL